jgi:hypothetical protein
MSFWKHNGWKLRTDLRVMQVALTHDHGDGVRCSC